MAQELLKRYQASEDTDSMNFDPGATLTPQASEAGGLYYGPGVAPTIKMPPLFNFGFPQATHDSMASKQGVAAEDSIVVNGVKYVKVVEEHGDILLVDRPDVFGTQPYRRVPSDNGQRGRQEELRKEPKTNLDHPKSALRISVPESFVPVKGCPPYVKRDCENDTTGPWSTPSGIVVEKCTDYLFHDKLVEIIVGTGILRYSYYVHSEVAEHLFEHEEFHDKRSDAVHGKPIWIEQDLPEFATLLYFVYQQRMHELDWHLVRSLTVDWNSLSQRRLLGLHKAAEYFKFYSITEQILSCLSRDSLFFDILCHAQTTYASERLEESCRLQFKTDLINYLESAVKCSSSGNEDGSGPVSIEAQNQIKEELCELSAVGGPLAQDITEVLFKQCKALNKGRLITTELSNATGHGVDLATKDSSPQPTEPVEARAKFHYYGQSNMDDERLDRATDVNQESGNTSQWDWASPNIKNAGNAKAETSVDCYHTPFWTGSSDAGQNADASKRGGQPSGNVLWHLDREDSWNDIQPNSEPKALVKPGRKAGRRGGRKPKVQRPTDENIPFYPNCLQESNVRYPTGYGQFANQQLPSAPVANRTFAFSHVTAVPIANNTTSASHPYTPANVPSFGISTGGWESYKPPVSSWGADYKPAGTGASAKVVKDKKPQVGYDWGYAATPEATW